MLDQLFGSKTRVALLKHFFENPSRSYYVRELTRELDAQINSIRRELDNLTKLGIVKVVHGPTNKEDWDEPSVPRGLNKRKFFMLDTSFVLNEDLSGIFAKSHLLSQRELMDKLRNLENAKYIILTGFFTGIEHLPTDLFIVGEVNKYRVITHIKELEEQMGREINYTIMPSAEFQYRQDISDKFLYDIISSKNIIVLDNLEDHERPQLEKN